MKTVGGAKIPALHVEFSDDHCLHHVMKAEKYNFNFYIKLSFIVIREDSARIQRNTGRRNFIYRHVRP